MDTIFGNNFRFIATRYEEWQAGLCISKGMSDAEIVAEVIDGETIRFKIEDADDLNIVNDFSFELLGNNSEALPDRVQYIHSTMDYDPAVPIVCNIFFKDNKVDYIRFAMTNPDRLIEFYGHLTEVSQPQRLKPQSEPDYSQTTAESIIRELKSYGMYQTDAILERAVKLYNANCASQEESGIRLVIESLKLFVIVYKMVLAEQEESGKILPLMPKVIMFLSLANHTIANFDRAYKLAKLGLDYIREVQENSAIIGLPDEFFGADKMYEVIDYIEDNLDESMYSEEGYEEVDPCIIETDTIDRYFQGQLDDVLSKDYIKRISDRIDRDIDFINQYARSKGITETVPLAKIFMAFRVPLAYYWEYAGYGSPRDLNLTSDDLMSLFNYVNDPLKPMNLALQSLEADNPLGAVDKEICSILIPAYKAIIDKIQNENP